MDIARIPDAVPRVEPPCVGCQRPYVVAGRRYVPLASAAGYRAEGMASWYGRKFHGRPTANGERYDMYAMTAAHPLLPIPSYAAVTNLANGRRVVVRINDRGPFRRDRIIDLSYVAAAKLGMVGPGSARVEVHTIMPGSAPAAGAGVVYVQAGAFARADNARALAQRLERAQLGPVHIETHAGAAPHRVRVGPVTRAAAAAVVARLAALGLSAHILSE